MYIGLHVAGKILLPLEAHADELGAIKRERWHEMSRQQPSK